MDFTDEEMLWAMDTLAEQQHPDPLGLLAVMQRTDDANIARVTEEEGQAAGVPYVDEPMMSMFAALHRDVSNPDTTRYAHVAVDKQKVQHRLDNALIQGKPSRNPFVTPDGFLKLRRGRKSPKPFTDEQLKQQIRELIDSHE